MSAQHEGAAAPSPRLARRLRWESPWKALPLLVVLTTLVVGVGIVLASVGLLPVSQVPVFAAVAAAGAVGTVVAHEWGHVLVARRRGERLVIVRFMWAGVGVGLEGRHTRTNRDQVRVSIAGPAVEALAGALAVVLAILTREVPGVAFAAWGVAGLAVLNAGLNLLLPVPPLDGFKIALGIWRMLRGRGGDLFGTAPTPDEGDADLNRVRARG